MNYKTKSALIGRSGKRDELGNGPIFVHLFDVNDPHKQDIVPKTFINFEKVHKVIIKGLEIEYLLAGSDMLINNLKSIHVVEGEMGHVTISGEQE